MNRRLLVTVLLAACGGTVTPTRTPSPPAMSPAELSALHDEVRVAGLEERRFGYDQYWQAVSSHLGGPVSVSVAGHSGEGREIRRLTFGSGPTTVLLWSQMHGNESTASMSLADIIRFFSTEADHPLARRIAQGATVHMVPMLNPDGAERFQRRNAQGIDVNRDARRHQTPEGKTLKGLSDRLEPDFGFNLHDQNIGTRVGGTGRGVAIALLAPAFDESRSVNPLRERAMRVASVIVGAIDPLVGGRVARYDDTFNPRAFGDLMAAWGDA